MSQLQNVRSLLPSYTGRIKIGSGRALGLALLLAKAAPPGLSPAQRKKLNALEAEGQEVENARSIRSRNGATIQPLRSQFAAGWSALDLALEAITQLPAQLSDHAERARVLRARLFPEGREFMLLSALESWTHAESIFRRIGEEELEEELLELVGPRFLKGAKLVTSELGDALGLGATSRKIPSATAVADAMDGYTTALAAYARALAADVDENDEASCTRFFEALAPIDLYRSTYTGTDDDEEIEPVVVTPAPLPSPAPTPAPSPLPSPFVNE